MTLFILSSLRAKNREHQLKERIAMDLHDEVGTMLTRALYVARTDDKTATNSHLIQSLNESLFSLRAHINTMNHTSFSFPALADDVKEMTQSLLGMTNCRGLVEDKTDDPYRIQGALCRDIRLCLYEIINNTLKHSGADTLRIYLTAHRNVLTVFTRDNGVLKRVEDIGAQGNGIRNLGKRVSKHGGSIEFGIPKAGHGLTVRMRFEI
jgi:signal transduction histidine kinase